MSKFIFKDEEDTLFSEESPKVPQKTWRILVVDDDESVHIVTKLVLADAIIEKRSLELVSVYSAAEAQALLLRDSDFCMAFVDVVMETDHAGLELVEWIRNELKNQEIRLILRTGQAGTAPESKVIREFDINDYKEKTDFTAGKMTTTVYASIRAYRDIMTIKRSLNGFKNLLTSTHDLLKINQFKLFGSAALTHLLTLMDLESSALYIARKELDFDLSIHDKIIACTGKYVSESSSLENSEISLDVQTLIEQAFNDKQHYLGSDCFVGFYQTAPNVSSVLYIEFEDDVEKFRSHFAELFVTNIALTLENLTKHYEIEQTQKDLLHIVGDAIEAKGKTTGKYVKRIAMICCFIAEKLGLAPDFINAIRLSAPLHDIGKLAIPDEILKKPSTLNNDEWGIMQTHALAGGALLERSKASAAKVGAKIALYHHENWDGSGYPEGLAGKEIPIEARIMAIVDVYDSLGAIHCYKEAWSEEKIKAYILENKSKKFDPEIVDLFIEHYATISNIETLLPEIDES